MKVVDLRHPAVIHLTSRWQNRGRSMPRGAAWAATRLADAWLARQASRRPAAQAPPFVVSIGNLALGGTGKTPVTARLAADLAAAGLRGAVLTRGFGSRLRGPLTVAPWTEGAGDEARMLAGLLAPSGWTVVQARRRPPGLAWLLAQDPRLDVVLLEDAHQTAGVGRHLDILILDAWREEPRPGGARLSPLTGPVAPFGPWRESARGAGRAGIWLVEGGVPAAPPPPGVAVAAFSRRYRLAAPPPGNFALLSGIARPDVFEAEARRQAGMLPSVAIRCADHEPYGLSQLARIDRHLSACGAAAVITTAKDFVKLAPVWGGRPPLTVLEMQVRWEGLKALPELVRERLDAVRRGNPTG